VDTASREYDFEAMGIEPSSVAVELARGRFDVEVECGLLDASSQLPRDFGVLTLWDVIEHVEDPEALVECCASHLAEGGVFVLETPDGDTPLRSLIRWLGSLGVSSLDMRGSVYYSAHRYYFNRRAMRQLLQRCGFSDIRFYAEHTMYKKELLYYEMYGMNSPLKKTAIRAVAAITRALPFLGNKMVVTAVKSTGD
jgi:2-polyprenyl-6-hydroxyphenyl methylase/3-demethylubiquinone-9 3-methyltransferase